MAAITIMIMMMRCWPRLFHSVHIYPEKLKT